MATKNFRLEAVLRYRRSLEQKWQTEVANTVRRIMDEQDRMNEYIQAQVRGHDELNRELMDGLGAARMKAFRDFETGIDNWIKDASSRIDQLQTVLQKKREALLRATTNRKAVERLKELHGQRVREEAAQVERKQIDDFAVIRHNQRESVDA